MEQARERGTLEWVRPLLEAFRDRPEEDIRAAIADMLGALKISDAAAVLADALDDPAFQAQQADIIGFLWSCGFQRRTIYAWWWRVQWTATSGVRWKP